MLKRFRFESRWTKRTLVFPGLFALALLGITTLGLFTRTPTALAADPGGGTINVTATSALVWKGTALGGVSPNSEADCTEGQNCDTFKLTLGGLP